MIDPETLSFSPIERVSDGIVNFILDVLPHTITPYGSAEVSMIVPDTHAPERCFVVCGKPDKQNHIFVYTQTGKYSNGDRVELLRISQSLSAPFVPEHEIIRMAIRPWDASQVGKNMDLGNRDTVITDVTMLNW